MTLLQDLKKPNIYEGNLSAKQMSCVKFTITIDAPNGETQTSKAVDGNAFLEWVAMIGLDVTDPQVGLIEAGVPINLPEGNVTWNKLDNVRH
jgi:hypothetical protein